jgi:transcriptional regulator with XRE-family HTH domain
MSTQKTAVQQALVQLRHRMNLTQQQLGCALKVGPKTVARWESSRSPSGRSLALLADFGMASREKEIAAIFISHTASILIAQGVHPKAIQALLRHRSIQITMDRYGHLFDEVQRETADKMDAVFGSQSDPVAVKSAVKPPEERPN